MGTILKIKDADFSENGMRLITPPTPEVVDVMPQFQANTLPVGQCVVIGGTGNVTTSQGTAVVGVLKTKIEASANHIFRMKPKDGFEIEMGLWKDGVQVFAGSMSNGGWSSNTTYAWWSGEFVCNTRLFDTFAFNVRKTDLTPASSNTLSDYIEYAQCSYVDDTTDIGIVRSVLETSYFENAKYGAATIHQSPPADTTGKRNGIGLVLGYAINNLSFTVTAKSGCKFVPIQCTDTSSGAQFSFSWVTGSTLFTNIASYPRIGFNLAYADDRVIPEGTSIWDFIEVTI